ncbi:hypothetical protein TWF481_010790 [Arthrobotrys musiformis]|uniref:BTB domain-containing protein n=1 Tax=Arthrobotrys musiformis TaxID=47236 RepID=A0AAV9W1W4_9PEZI
MEVKKHEYSKSPDLIVELYRDEEIVDKVYGTSSAIRNASAVFNRMLDPENGFGALPTEIDFGKQLRVLSLPEDDAESMLIILKIIHYQTKTIPETLSFKSVVELAVICDKYDCAGILRPWSNIWISNLMKAEDHEVSKYEQEEWLLIAHVFPDIEGIGNIVHHLSVHLALECCSWSPDRSQFRRYLKTSNLKQRLDPTQARTTKLRFTPDTIIRHIFTESERRKLLVTAIRKFCAGFGLVEMEEAATIGCSNDLCAELATGSILKAIKDLGISLSQISDPEGLKDYPTWAVGRLLHSIASQCKTVVPWTMSSHPVIVQHASFSKNPYAAHVISHTPPNIFYIQAAVLLNPLSKCKLTNTCSEYFGGVILVPPLP